ncbi:SDR family NAD(P)-dependent oxidoreductase [Oecophyllibacter saccharovorans]|uniref:SDR family NAD(P)-dependent oxidoreductase n=1 Tax=Oecophyllibacter saccharovorans TaxID=2558360 RepID=UPI00116F7370|nr:SDR family NAD(P)-dependent oxidoreductase [Oecophyllibacter saccharovorans]TPW36346.1 SDR family NAD(P)-dependent oxidoreductase [Oecophyllibacter saccharovorans]
MNVPKQKPDGAGRTVFVTGASAGFGQAIARRLLGEGCRVIGSARRLERLTDFHQALPPELRGNFLPLQLDMTDIEALRALPGSLPADWQQIDVLINNAGLALGVSPAQDCNPDDWDRMIATNVTGLVELTRALLPGMKARNRGYLMAIGSTAGIYPYQGGNVYGATKAFVAQFMANLRTDLLGSRLRVTTLEPGLCGGTEFSDVRLGDPDKARQVYAGTQPLTATDIAETVSWLLSLPEHVNVNRIEMMPTCQAPGGLAVARDG